METTVPYKPHVLVIGAGFGGLEVCKGLKKTDVQISLVDRQNYHLFQPLLYQVAGAALSPADIAYPIRAIFRGQTNVSVYMGEATYVDLEKRLVSFHEGSTYYDYLVLAAGATHSYFGRDEWSSEAPGLKSIEDATEIRKRILLAFEEAEYEADEASRRTKLTFVIVGGGPTGVELAGTLKEIAVGTIPQDFRNVDTKTARIVVVQAADRLLPTFDPKLSERAKRDLESMGVEVLLNARVTNVDELGVMVGNTRLQAQNIFWAAGVQGSPLAKTLGVPLDRTGRVIVGSDLSIPGHPEVFVIGDMASMTDANTHQPVPGVAQGAKQSGRFVGEIIKREVSARWHTPRPSFVYHDRGSMAAIGKAKAIAQVGRFRFSGFPAWVAWSIVHVLFLVGFRNRLSVLAQWVWNYIFSARGARLITGERNFSVKKFREVVPHKLPHAAQRARTKQLAEMSAELHTGHLKPVQIKGQKSA